MDESNRSVERYVEGVDDRGRKILRPIYLKETPPEEFDRLNKMFKPARVKVKK